MSLGRAVGGEDERLIMYGVAGRVEGSTGYLWIVFGDGDDVYRCKCGGEVVRMSASVEWWVCIYCGMLQWKDESE